MASSAMALVLPAAHSAAVAEQGEAVRVLSGVWRGAWGAEERLVELALAIGRKKIATVLELPKDGEQSLGWGD